MNRAELARELDRSAQPRAPYSFVVMLPLVLALASGCSERRALPAPTPVFNADVALILKQRCEECHGDDADAGDGFRVGSYLETIACPNSRPEASAVARSDAGVPLLAVLARPDHARLLDAAEKVRLSAWIDAGVPLQEHGVHAPGILDPHSRDWHGKLAARDHFGPIKSASHPDVCGRCHDGAPVRPESVSLPAAGAPACTSCHAAPHGVLACGTCHGDGASRAYPPRDACFFPNQKPSAHRAHVETTLSAQKLSCSTCHPKADATLSGTHANGKLDVAFDAARAGDDASYDPATGVCAVRCHNQGGARVLPSFGEMGPLGCGDCHGAPPANHYAGSCDFCHHSANADGTALVSTALHIDGQVNLGDNSGDCSACHGQNGDPMPNTPSHVLHRTTTITAPIDCSDCHVVPSEVTSPGHLDVGMATPADVVFGARAQARGRHPSYDAGTCRDIACHGAGLAEGIERALHWDSPAAQTCAGCHGIPPSKDHPNDTSCATVICHGSEVAIGASPNITAQGRALHIDGMIETAGAP